MVSPASVDPIAKDSQANGATASAGTTLSVSLTVADNTNRVLICCTSCYNPEPESTACTFGSQNFIKVDTSLNSPSNGRADMWVLVNPDADTHDVEVTWGETMGKRGIGCYCFYNVLQTNPTSTPPDCIGVRVTDDSGGQADEVVASITPTTENSMIVDALSWIIGSGYIPVDTLTAGWTNLYPSGKTGASQYDLTPTISSANSMNYTNDKPDALGHWANIMTEIKNG